VRFETEPGQQAQVDYGQLRVWIADRLERSHLFVFTLGYSRRLFVQAYRDEKLGSLLDGHQQAFCHFGGHDRRPAALTFGGHHWRLTSPGFLTIL